MHDYKENLLIMTFKLTFITQEKYAKVPKKVFRLNIIILVLFRLICIQSSVSLIPKLSEIPRFGAVRYRSGFRSRSCAFSAVSTQGNQ